jgi:predicted dehydrogenase/threonine dehydrogenase-like Zn-dependent dehydrogenase
MKQVLQNLRTGDTTIADIPRPMIQAGQVLVGTRYSVVSTGTERMLVEFGAAGWIEKARQQPDKVRMVLDKVRTDGLAATWDTVMRKLDQPLAMGYCNVGEVVQVGAGVTAFKVGDLVVSNGKHAEFVAVPANLCALVPQAVPADHAAFTPLGAIALQGIRLAQPSLGERVVVMGLGLVGLLAVQLLRSQGCRVLAFDFDAARVELAARFGAEAIDLSTGADPCVEAQRFTRGQGVDAVIIAASTTSSEPVSQAARMCRKRGRVVLVGVTGLELLRADFYEKEISFQVSCSYGPGRYDTEYEEKGRDYPFGYVRWTEQRNFEAVLDMMASGRVDVRPLISHRFQVTEAQRAYELIASTASSLGIVLEYPREPSPSKPSTLQVSPAREAADSALAFLGAGNYATAILIPAFKASGARLRSVSSALGVSAAHAARKFGFELATTDTRSTLEDAEVRAVVVCTRHASHGSWVRDALLAGKHVFVEKPLAMTLEEVDTIERLYGAKQGTPPLLMVGFNRRFAPLVRETVTLLDAVAGPKSFVMTVNAGAIPPSHWTQDLEAGGGRVIGEACHFIDLLRFLARSPIRDVAVASMPPASDAIVPDTCTITLRFDDGSIGAIHYFANGHKSVPKERLEVFASGRVLRLDNFRKLEALGWPGFRTRRAWRQDKGQHACAKAFVDAVTKGGPSPIPLEELLEVARVTIEASELARVR